MSQGSFHYAVTWMSLCITLRLFNTLDNRAGRRRTSRNRTEAERGGEVYHEDVHHDQ